MRIAIVDDNHTDRIFLREGLERILLKRNIENSEIHIFNSAEDILEYLKNEQETFFDLIFMDIYMEKLTGVDAAREIRKKDKKVKIVFITTSNEFASESYEVRAEDYLIKPYDKTRLENVMDRIFSEKKYGKILELKDGRKIIINSIVYTTFSGHYVTIYLKDETSIQVRCTQKNFEKQIEHFPQLISSFKGITVNLAQVDNIESDRFKMKNGSFVPISRRKYAEIKKAYTRFLIEALKE